jgi:hypothetical protein
MLFPRKSSFNSKNEQIYQKTQAEKIYHQEICKTRCGKRNSPGKMNMLREVSHSHRNKCHIFSLIVEVKGKQNKKTETEV